MLMNERRAQILSILHQKRSVTVKKLCESLYSSPATIRRDLSEMAAQGMIFRLRGGAQLPDGGNSDMPLLLRIQKEKARKEAIASIALRYLKDVSTILMDSSSTVYYLARRLKGSSGMSVITNGLATVNYLNEQTALSVYCTGGRLFHQSSCVGDRAIETVRSFCADVFLFSCCGFSVSAGSTEAEEENAAVKREMSLRAKRKILLCDSTKFGKDYFCRACPVEAIDLIITDQRPDAPAAERLKGKLVFPE